MIYTSYFGNWRKWGKYTPISIARYSPKNWTGLEYKKAAPSEWLLEQRKSGLIGDELFKKLYLNEIGDVGEIKKELENMGNGDIVLLCYEKTGDFCHRYILGEEIGAKEL